MLLVEGDVILELGNWLYIVFLERTRLGVAVLMQRCAVYGSE
jgi:hypothetical protein